MNLHAPERQPGESQVEYRKRRARSREAVKISVGGKAPNVLDRLRKAFMKSAAK